MSTECRQATDCIACVVICLAATILGIRYIEPLILYHPREYHVSNEAQARQWTQHGQAHVHSLSFDTSEGKQFAYYVTRKNSSMADPVERVWIMFGGNAMLALEWRFHIDSLPMHNISFLLIEYPGYGGNPGSPSPTKILETTWAAIHCLKNLRPLTTRYGVLGHSLGAAAALQWIASALQRTHSSMATTDYVERVVLLAPFSSTVEMAKFVLYGLSLPWDYILLHRFDNAEKLSQIAHLQREVMAWACQVGLQGATGMDVHIFHGNQDKVIPLTVSLEEKCSALIPVDRSLCPAFRDCASSRDAFCLYFKRVYDADHISILYHTQLVKLLVH